MKTPQSFQLRPELGVPTLPGYKIPAEFTKSDFKKQHTLDYKNGYTVSKAVGTPVSRALGDVTDAEIASLMEKASATLRFGNRVGNHFGKSKPKFDDANVAATPISVEEAAAAKVAKPFTPIYAALDKIVLRFDAYLKETFPDGNRGPLPGANHTAQEYVIRHVMIKYFMEDDSISVVEPPVENSGLPQGTLIRRQLLPKAITDMVGGQVEYYTIRDIALGKDMVFYGKTYHVVGCDQYTENYLRDVLKMPLQTANPVEPLPKDPYIEVREHNKKVAAEHRQSSPEAHHNEKLKQFLQNDRKVLRFYCTWDDRESLYGEVRDFIIHYFLVDDSIEVREVQKPNSGRDPFPILSRRQMLPKKVQGLADLATTTPLGTELDWRSHNKTNFYNWRDLRIGSTLNVLGRNFLIHDCDAYTREYFVHQLGLTQQQLAPVRPAHLDEHAETFLKAKESDVSSSKKVNVQQLLANEGKNLRYVAYLDSKHKEDEGRRFVVIYRLADDTVSIYEPPVRNAGIMGGKFMARGTPSDPATGKQYTAADFFVGAKISVYCHSFILCDADEFVYKWMEEHSKEFPKSDAKAVMGKVRAAIPKQNIQYALEQEFASTLTGKDSLQPKVAGVLSRERFVKALKHAAAQANADISHHEFITIARKYAQPGSKQVHFQLFVGQL